MIVKNVNHKLEEKIVYVEDNHAKGGRGVQYSLRNNVEISGIPNNISDKYLENSNKYS